MYKFMGDLFRRLTEFSRDESGVVTVEFVLIFPLYFGLFLMTFESGIGSIRQTMLDRGVDLAVRDVRIGIINPADPDDLKPEMLAKICETAYTIPDCTNQLQLEMVIQDLRSWDASALSSTVQCIDRGEAVQPVTSFTSGGNNQLVVLRACVRVDPFLPFTGIGLQVVENNTDTAAAGSYALVSTSAFVVEPYESLGTTPSASLTSTGG